MISTKPTAKTQAGGDPRWHAERLQLQQDRRAARQLRVKSTVDARVKI